MMRFIFFFILILITAMMSQPISVDILIKNGLVFDGTNNMPRKLTIGIKNGVVTYISDNNTGKISAAKTIDASGYWVTPGFIDPHTHCESDLSSNKKKSNLAYLKQGVTTVMAGNDGTSPYPIGTKLQLWEQQGVGTNVGLFIGHGTVRRFVIGDQNKTPDEALLRKMKLMVDSAMRDGAFGLSTGLFYAPGSYAQTSEVIELAKIASQYRGIYDTHIRDESSYNIGLEASIREAIEIGKQSGAAVHISHIKALGVDKWGKSQEIISMIDSARSAGLTVTANQYPYNASRTSLVAAVVPRWAEEMGSAGMMERLSKATQGDSLTAGIKENIRRRGSGKALQISGAKYDSLEHKTIEELAMRWRMSEEETVIRIIRLDPSVRVVSFNMSDQDLENFTKQPWIATGSDGTPGHPRKYGTFIKRLKDYALVKKIITPEFAIHAATGMTAGILGIERRGYIRKDYYADIIIFNPGEINTNATFENPDVLAEGMRYVIVNGTLTIDKGEYTGSLAGKALRHR